MWSSSLTAKLSRSRVPPRSTCAVDLEQDGALVRARAPCRRSARRRRRGSPVGRDVEELARDRGRPRRRRRRRAPRRPSANARSTPVSKPVDTISCCGSPVRRSSGGSDGEPGVQRRRVDVAVEREVQLVVERPDPVPRRDRLRDVREARDRRVELEALGEQVARARRRRRARTRAEHRHEPARAEGAHHLVVVILERGRRDADERALLAQDRAVERLELGPRLDPELVDERPAGVVVDGRAPRPADRDR